MSEEQGTLNETQGESSPPAPVQSGDLVSTIDVKIPSDVKTSSKEEPSSEETQKTEGPEGSDKGEGKDETKDVDAKEADTKADDRFDKHPRFQELISDRREMKNTIAQLTEEIANLKQSREEPARPTYDNFGDSLVEVLGEDLFDKFEDDPKSFMTKFASQLDARLSEQVGERVMSQVQDILEAKEMEAQEKQIEHTFNSYAQTHPDFDEMWDSGDLKRFMDENPGHNAISAHAILTEDKKLEAERQKAAKEAEKQVLTRQKAKKNAAVLGSGPSAGGRTVGQVPAELKDTKKYGGLASVLASRSLARENRRQAS